MPTGHSEYKQMGRKDASTDNLSPSDLKASHMKNPKGVYLNADIAAVSADQ